jgi:hypothetical protein
MLVAMGHTFVPKSPTGPQNATTNLNKEHATETSRNTNTDRNTNTITSTTNT